MSLSEYKADLASGVIYIVYKDEVLGLKSYFNLELIKTFSELDKVSQIKKNRKNQILHLYKYQNPFLSNPKSIFKFSN